MSTRLRAVAARYSNTADPYRRFWAPTLVAHSRPLMRALPLDPNDRIADLGCGVGVIGARVAQRVRAVIGIDVAEGMLKLAPRGVAPIAGDIMRLPLADGTLDGAYSTFALQHVSRTGAALTEVARALRTGGFLGTATWGKDEAEIGGVYDVLEDVFARHRIPAETPPLKTWHERVDEPGKIERHARAAGLTVQRVWTARSTYVWPVAGLIGWTTTMGPYGRRLAEAPDVVCARLIEDLHNDLAALPESAFSWTPQCVYMIALKE